MSFAHQRAAETEPILKLLWGSWAVTMRWSVPYLQTLRQHNQPVFWGLHNLSYCGNEIFVQKWTLKELKTYFFREFHTSIPDEGNDWELCSKNAEESVCRGRKFIESSGKHSTQSWLGIRWTHYLYGDRKLAKDVGLFRWRILMWEERTDLSKNAGLPSGAQASVKWLLNKTV